MLCNWRMPISVNRSRSPASHVPPLRKKSYSVFLLGCKRPHNEKPSLPTFCGNAPAARWQEAFPSRESFFSFTCSALLAATVMLCNWRMPISVNRSRSPASHVPPLRKKSYSVFLLGCKRPHNEKPSLPTFCGNAPAARWQEAFPSRESALSFTCSALLAESSQNTSVRLFQPKEFM